MNKRYELMEQSFLEVSGRCVEAPDGYAGHKAQCERDGGEVHARYGPVCYSRRLSRTDIMPVTLLIIAITCVVSFVAFKRPQLWHKLVLWPPGVTRGHEYWRLVTSGFVHADLQHLLFNMITLFFFGRLMERFFAFEIGELGYVLFYLGGVLVSILPSYLSHRAQSNYVSLGASGAVSAVLFAFILLQPWALIFVFFFPLPAVLYAVMYVGYSIYMDHRGRDNINHSAHLWGAAYGVLFTLAVDPRVSVLFVERVVHPHF